MILFGSRRINVAYRIVSTGGRAVSAGILEYDTDEKEDILVSHIVDDMTFREVRVKKGQSCSVVDMIPAWARNCGSGLGRVPHKPALSDGHSGTHRL